MKIDVCSDEELKCLKCQFCFLVIVVIWGLLGLRTCDIVSLFYYLVLGIDDCFYSPFFSLCYVICEFHNLI